MIEGQVSGAGIDDLHHRSDLQSTETWACNWKVAIINAMESYHLFKVHPDTLEPFTPTRDAYYVAGSARATATGGAFKGQDTGESLFIQRITRRQQPVTYWIIAAT